MQPVTLFDQSLDPMSYDAVAHLFAYGNADPVPVQFISTHIQDKISVHVGSAGAITFPEIIVLSERFHSLLTLPDTMNIHKLYIHYNKESHISAAFRSSHQTVSFFLPLALLAARTFLPPAELILDLNP